MLTRPACLLCPSSATADSPWCSEHLADAVEREQARIRKARQRERHRAARRCIDCGRSSELKRCRRCHRKRKRRSGQGVTPGVTQTPTLRISPRHAELAARTITHADGRTRYHGKARKGPPTSGETDAWDLRTLRAELELAAAAVDASHSPEVRDLPRIQRDAIVQDALSHLGLLERQLDELVDRLKRRLR
jgi:hypothetical protein